MKRGKHRGMTSLSRERLIYWIKSTMSRQGGESVRTIEIRYRSTPEIEEKVVNFLKDLVSIQSQHLGEVSCANCGKKGVKLHRHHILNQKMFPETGPWGKIIWLCPSCHQMIEIASVKFIYSDNPQDFEREGINSKLAKEIIDTIRKAKEMGYDPQWEVRPFELRPSPYWRKV